MRRWSNSPAWSFVLAAALLAPTAAAADQLDRLEEEIDSWRLTEAKNIFDSLTKSEKGEPRARFMTGKLLFHEGRFKEALAELRRAIEGARAEIDWKILRDRIMETERVLSGLELVKGVSGRFVYRYARGPDALLVPYAEDTLTRQMSSLSELLGDRPSYPIEIDFLPDTESFAAVSGLSVEQIERTGTVGVTKYGRIMVITPRKLATGYPWLDTLAHELTHLFITRVSRNRAAIWLHEGMAKLLERRWRERGLQELTPEEAYLLDRAARERRLIPLRRFHPSVAHLPDQEDAALAYAQVLSFMRYLDERLGNGWARELLERLGKGESIDNALVAMSKFKLQRLYQWWRQAVSGKRQTPVPAVGLMKRRFKRGEVVAGDSGQTSLLKDDVRRHLRVGDLLRLRGHITAAVVEYQQADKLATSPSPEISDRLGACLLGQGKADEVVAALQPVGELYPSHSTVFVQLGEAFTALNKNDEAIAAFRRANAINPFHPNVHCTLATLYRGAGLGDRAEQESDHCRLVAATSGTEIEAQSQSRP